MTAKEAALELALMILHSVIPSKEATELMDKLEGIANHSQAKPEAKDAFAKANTLYSGLDESKAQHIFIVEPGDQAKFCELRDLLLAVSEHISEHQYLVTVEGWDMPRELKILADQKLAFQLTVCTSDCSGCAQRVRDVMAANEKVGGVMSIIKANGGETWVQLPDPKVGNLNKYLEDSLGIRIVQLTKI